MTRTSKPIVAERVLRELILNPAPHLSTVAQLADLLGHSTRIIRAVLTEGQDRFDGGWEHVLGNDHGEWTYDPATTRIKGAVVDGGASMVVLTQQDGRVLLRDIEGGLWVATPFKLEAVK